MRKAIYPLVFLLSIVLTSCSSIMNNLPGVYTIDIQRGNIVNQEMIDQLRPEMTKRQVLYIMGSSMLVDVFHQKRWDYLYSVQPGGEHRKQKRLSLFFDGDKLIGVQGDFRPSTLPVIRQSNETTVEVPKRDLDKTLWGKINKLLDDDAPVKPQADTIIEEEPTDVPFKPVYETIEKSDTNEEITITPLDEEVPQELEKIADDQIPTVNQSESNNENTEISMEVSENEETITPSMTDNNQEELKEVTGNEPPINIQTEADKEITEFDQELIENEKILQEDVTHKIEESSVDKKSAIAETESSNNTTKTNNDLLEDNDASKELMEESNQKEKEQSTIIDQAIETQLEVDKEKTEFVEDIIEN